MNQLQTGKNGFQVRQPAMSRYCAVCRLFALAALLPLVSATATASPPEDYDYDLPRAEDEVERCAWVGPSPGEEVLYVDAIDVSSSDVARASGPTERIVCRIHVVRRSDGSGGFDEALIPKMMQDLNYGFRNTSARFVREPGVVYVDNDTYYADFPTFQSGFTMLTDHFESGVMSWYITPCITNCVSGAGTWIGGAFDGRGIMMAYFAAGSPANIVTAPHEMGHIFQVIHPYFTGFGTECTSGSNCLPAGDLVCDTPASPLVFGGSPNGNTTATGIFYRNIPGPCAGDPPYAPRTDLYMEAGWAAGHILRDQWTRGQLERMDDHLFGNGVVWPVDDLIGPDRPDFLVDCDGNGLDDMDEILAGTKTDLGRDMVPDVCQALPAVGDLVVSGMTSVRTNRPRFYDGQTGAWRGDLWNGMTFAHQLRRGPDGLIYMARLTIIQRISTETARTVDNFIDGILEGAGTFVDLLFEPSGDILVLDNVSRNIRRYSGTDGSFLGQFMHLNTTGMTSPKYMEYGPDGRIYIVGSAAQGNTIQRIDQNTGQALGSFITPGAGGLTAGQGLVFHTDGMLYVSNGGGNNVLRYNGTTAPGYLWTKTNVSYYTNGTGGDADGRDEDKRATTILVVALPGYYLGPRG